MDTDTGKLLSYRQLTRKPKFKKNWCTYSANEFWRIENGVDGRIKNPANTIAVHHKKVNTKRSQKRCNIHAIRVKCTAREERKEQNEIHRRRRKNRLPRWSSHTHGRYARLKKSSSTASSLQKEPGSWHLMYPTFTSWNIWSAHNTSA